MSAANKLFGGAAGSALEIHGLARLPTWTVLALTVPATPILQSLWFCSFFFVAVDYCGGGANISGNVISCSQWDRR